ncbi:hypothetical protein GCM10009676_00540 [Prauserella halophila]|uniref:DUF317 domain-containing protein n=1 Tax=Prauserella halophila TaxID=185641 RepID=A0ABN1VXC9_9PSEU|nr:hypothetical protein [Prauserella halophila]MCP2234602.1 hypothetical protein [Prauserella halophila]
MTGDDLHALRGELEAVERRLGDIRARLDEHRGAPPAGAGGIRSTHPGTGETLERVEAMHEGGTVAYRVTVDGVFVGWVGDGAPWRGHRYGGRRWWATWRQDGDTAARWSSELEYPTRARALAALVARITS